MTLNSYVALVGSHLTAFRRSKMAIFWSLAFPIGFLFLFGGVMARGNARAATFMLPGLLTTMLTSGSLFGIAIPMVLSRETGVLRRFRVAPLRASTMVLAHGTTGLIQNAFTFCMLLVVARLAFRTEIAGSLSALAVVFFFSAFAMVPIGLLVGSAARDMRTAPPIVNLLFFPLMFLSGSAFPYALLPDAVKQVARFLPTTYIVEVLQGVIVRGEGLTQIAGPLGILALLGSTGVILSSMLFRWEGTEPLPRRSVFIILGAFATVLLLAGFGAPAFRMNELPGRRAIEPGAAKGVVRVLRGATVLDGLGGRIENARVVIRSHKVESVAPDSASDPLPEGAVVEDLTGRYLIPGLFDSHIHLGGSGGVSADPAEQSGDRLVRDLNASLASGVTSIVSLTDDPESLARLRALVASAEQRAPRVFFSGASITAPGGHPAEMFSFVPGLAEQLTRQVTTPDEARAAVKDMARYEADLIKLVLEPGFPGRPMKRLDLASFKAAVEEAKARGLKTTVHAGTDEDVRAAIENGADGIEHAARNLSASTIALMAARKITFTPTLSVYDFAWKRGLADGSDTTGAARFVIPEILAGLRDPKGFFVAMAREEAMVQGLGRVFDQGLASVEAAAIAGVPILAGSDAGNPATFHGTSLIHELELLARARMPLAEVLKAATSRPADRLGERTLGRIEKGAIADLVVLDADPLADVAAYRRIAGLFLGGRKLDTDHLLDTPAGPWRRDR